MSASSPSLQGDARFLREGRVLQHLRPRGFPEVYELIGEPRPAIVMERLVGEDLEQRVQRAGRMPLDEVGLCLEQVGEAIEAMHCDYSDARATLEKAAALYADLGRIAALESELGESAFQKTWDAGRAYSVDALVQLAC